MSERDEQVNAGPDAKVSEECYRRTAWLLASALTAAAVGLAAGTLLLDRKASGLPLAAMLIVAAFLLVAAVAVPLAVLAMHRARQQRLAWLELESQELSKIADTIKGSPLGDLISFNFRLMERFVGVAITQSQASYLACLVAASVGLLVLSAGGAVALSVHGLASQITAGVLTAVGTAVGSYLSVTFLKTFTMTSKQLSYYYGQPLVHCYLLHAEWLGMRFEHGADPEMKWRIHQELIRAALGASRSAQDHLLDLQFESLKAAATSKLRSGGDPTGVHITGHEPTPSTIA